MAGKDGTIASRLQLEGEQEYKRALNDAYRSLRVLRSELKAETAELGRNASEQDKARKKAESLKKQIAEQEKVVKTLEQALKDSKEEFADNQEVQDKWEEKLNKARETLAKMKNDLEGATDGLKGLGSEMKRVSSDTTGAIQTVTTLKDNLTAIKDVATGIGGAIAGGFTNSLSMVESFVDKTLELMTKAWTAAGDWKQIQGMFGGSVEEIQRIYTGMQLQGVDTGSVTSGIQKLAANVHSGNKEAMAALKTLKIDATQYKSQWDLYVAVMDAIAGNKSPKTQDNLSRALFGEGQGAKQNDVLGNWVDAKEKYQADVGGTGLELSAPQIDALDEVSHKIEEIKTLWERIKMNVGAKLSEILNMDQLGTDGLELLRDTAAIFSGTGDRKELILKFSEDLDKFVKDVQEGMEDLSKFLDELGGDLAESDTPLVAFIGRLIQALGKFVDFLEKNGDTILAWLERMMPVIAVNKISEATTGKGLGEWGDSLLNWIMSWKLISAAKGGGGAGGGGTVATGGGGGGWLAKAMGPTAAFLGTLFENALTEQGNDDLTQDKNGQWRVGQTGKVYEEPTGGQVLLTVPEGYEKPKGSEPYEETEDVDLSDDAVLKLNDYQRELAEDYWDAIRQGDIDQLGTLMDLMNEAFGDDPAQLDLLQSLVESLTDAEFFDMEDLPDGWFADTKNAIEGLKAPDGWYANIQAYMTNLLKNQADEAKQRSQQKIVIQVTANSYLDGALIASNVSENIASGFSRIFN